MLNVVFWYGCVYQPMLGASRAQPESLWSASVGMILVVVALRVLARRRWLRGDLPRAATSPAS
jgi:hypothetical protein